MNGLVSILKGLFGRRRTLACIWASEAGAHRPENQDSVYVCSEAGVFVVADGMGGAQEGAVASQIVCRCLASVDWKALDFEGRVASVGEALKAANDEILDYVRTHGLAHMGTTVAVLVIDTANFRRASIVHVGDSRVYRVRGGKAEPLTADHTIGCELGMYRGDGRSGVQTGAASRLNHVLTRAIGIASALELESSPVAVEDGDRFLVCSDGVHDVLTSEKLSGLMSMGSLDEVRARLCKAVEDGGSPDNYTFVLVGTGACP